MRVYTALLGVGLIVGGCVSPEPTAPPEFVVEVNERQLFLDNVDIAKVKNLVRTLHRPTKKGGVVRPDQAWETSLQTRSVPAWDEKEKVFKIWMVTSTNVPGVAGTSYATSQDGLHWIKPKLNQWNFQGSRDNNFMALDPKMAWPDNAIVNAVYDPTDPDPKRRYKGLLGTEGRQPIVSPDGINWTRLDVEPIPSQDESNLSFDEKEGLFILTVKHRGPYGRSVHLSTSTDFEEWTKPVLIFHADEKDQELGRQNMAARRANTKYQMRRPLWDKRDTYKGHTAEPKVDVYNMGLFRYESLYIGTPSMFHSNDNRWNQDGFHLIQLVCTRDLNTFTRLGDRQPFIGPSTMSDATYDWTQLIGPSRPIVHGDELWFYYTGIKYRTRPEDAPKKGGAVCLAVLRRDGFVSLDATDVEGTVRTKTFVPPGDQLYVNADVTDGEMFLELLRGEEVVATSEPLTGDLLRAQVKWNDGDLTSFDGQTVNLRFTLSNGSLYSYWFGTNTRL